MLTVYVSTEKGLLRHVVRVKRGKKAFFSIIDLHLNLHHTVSSATALQFLCPYGRKQKKPQQPSCLCCLKNVKAVLGYLEL